MAETVYCVGVQNRTTGELLAPGYPGVTKHATCALALERVEELERSYPAEHYDVVCWAEGPGLEVCYLPGATARALASEPSVADDVIRIVDSAPPVDILEPWPGQTLGHGKADCYGLDDQPY